MPDNKKYKPDFARVIAISSGKGGVGKSTLAVNLSIALSNAGKKVCLFDADTNLANINILLGIVPSQTLEHFFNNDRSINEIITPGPGGIDIICGASGVADFIQFSPLQQKKLIQALRLLEENYQYLLIDTAAGIDETNISLILAAPYLLLTITGEPTSLTDAFSLLRVLKKHHFQRPILVVVNMSASRKSAQVTFKRFKMAVNKYLSITQVYLAGYIIDDKNIPISIVKQQAILLSEPDSPSSQCINNVCRRLLTSFEKSKQLATPFSDYFSEQVLLDDIDMFKGNIEPISSSSNSLQTEPAELESGLKQKGLLRASYYARLLGKISSQDTCT